MTTFVLIRHGQTDWNLENRLQGHKPIPLNAQGKRQAAAIAERLEGQPFTAIYTSDLLRASQTAEAIARSVHLPVHADARLREISHGRWEGHTVLEAGDLFPEDIELWSKNVLDAAVPGGETVQQVAARVREFLDDVAQAYPSGNILVVSHGFAIGMMLCLANSLPLIEAYNRVPDNTEPLTIEWPVRRS
jgi:probable phosphoglycerate mutase